MKLSCITYHAHVQQKLLGSKGEFTNKNTHILSITPFAVHLQKITLLTFIGRKCIFIFAKINLINANRQTNALFDNHFSRKEIH